MPKLFLITILLFISISKLFAGQTETDSLKMKIHNLELRVEKIEKAMGPGFSKDYYEDIENAFITVGYHQGTYTLTDSTTTVVNYGFSLHYAEDKISVFIDAAWGGDKFFSSFYLGYNFYGKQKRVVLTPLLGGISWGENIWDYKQSIWSYGLAITFIKKTPISVAIMKHEKGMGFSLAYRFSL